MDEQEQEHEPAHEHDFEPSARDFDGNVTEWSCKMCGFVEDSDAAPAGEEEIAAEERAETDGATGMSPDAA